jgi:hypothetical protein
MVLLGGAARAEAVPSINFTCTPAPEDCTGWYRSNVTIQWTVLPSTATKVAGCQNRTISNDTPLTNEYCSARDGQTVTVEVPISVDKTPPVVTAGRPERGADFNGWYNHPVAVAFSGSDQTSGIASCTSPTYAGPDGGSGFVFGTCIDNAGNVSNPFGYALSYDATAPPLAGLKAIAGDGRATLRWQTTGETDAVEVIRTPGRGAEESSVVFRGPGTKFEDTNVKNRKRYAYEVRVRDAAGNVAHQATTVVPHPHLVAPARLKALRRRRPPVLRWTPVRRARYYNVQLFRNGRKVLSAWPEKARYRLKRRWTYAGKRRRLVPGTYRWVVWPGYGARSKGNYGQPLGPRTFRITR